MKNNPFGLWRDDFFSNVEHEINSVLDKVFSKDFFEGVKDSGFPIADIYISDGKLNIIFPVAGVDPKDINISEKDGKLTISGFLEKRSEDATYHLSEWKRGAFSRTFNLPDNVDGDPEASVKNGVLTVVYNLITDIPTEETKEIKIKVVSE
jgi:HSP20 family protein